MAMPRLAGGTRVMSRPPMLSVPSLILSNPAIMRSSVLLPQPEGPTNTQNSPGATCRSRSWMTSWSPKRLTMWLSWTSDIGASPRHPV